MVHVLKFVLYSPCRCSSLPFTREIIWFISLFRINHHRHPDGNFVWKSKIYSKNKLGINKRYTVSADRRVICVAIDLISSVFFSFRFCLSKVIAHSRLSSTFTSTIPLDFMSFSSSVLLLLSFPLYFYDHRAHWRIKSIDRSNFSQRNKAIRGRHRQSINNFSKLELCFMSN